MKNTRKNRMKKIHIRLIIFFAIFLISFLTLISIEIKTKNYMEVEATITNTYLELDEPKFKGLYKTIEFTYTYNDKQYKDTDVVVLSSPEIGKKIKIKINPNEPIQVRSNFEYTLLITSSIVIFIVTLLFIKLYIDEKNNKSIFKKKFI